MKRSLQAHRVWLSLLALALVLLFVLPPLTEGLEKRMETRAAQLEKQRDTLFARIRQMESDAIAAEDLAQSIEAKEVARLLAPSSRAAAATQIEALASQARFDKLSYQIAPSAPLLAQGAPEDLIQTAITLEAEAPTDGDVFRFLESLDALTGRVELRTLSLRKQPAGSTPVALNIRVRAAFVWIANGEKAR